MMLGQPPQKLSDVIDYHPRSGWGHDVTWTVRYPNGAQSGHCNRLREAYQVARDHWPQLVDDSVDHTDQQSGSTETK